MGAKRILIVSHYYPPHVGGIEIVAYNEAVNLAARGCQVTVLTSKTPGDPGTGMHSGVRVVRVPAYNGLEKRAIPFPLFSPMLLIRLWQEMRHADVVHLHDVFYISSFCVALVARMLHKPVVVTQHVGIVAHPSKLTTAIERMVFRTTGKWVLHRASKVITINSRIKAFLVQLGVAPGKLVELNNGVDTALFHPPSTEERRAARKAFQLPERAFIVLFIGRFVPKKGFGLVCDAGGSEYLTVFAGGETDQEPTKNQRFLGRVDQTRLAQLYHAADLFILPSESEGFPLTAQEAMASGLPVILKYDPGYARYALQEHQVTYLDTPDAKQLRRVILELQADDARRAAMAKQASAYVTEHFSWDRHVEELIVLFERALRPTIVQIAGYYPPNLGGMERVAQELSEELARRSYDVRVLTSNVNQPKHPEPDAPNLRITRLRAFEFAHTPFAFGIIPALLRVPKHSILHLHLAQALYPECTFLVAKLRRMPYVVHFHLDLQPSGPFGKLFVPYKAIVISAVIKHANAVIVFSTDQQNFIHQTYGVPKKNIVIIPNGVGSEYFMDRSGQSKQAEASLLYVGRISQQKRVHILTEAMGLLHEPARLVVVGDGDERAQVEASIPDSLKARITFTGRLSPKKTLAYFRKADVFVMASRIEGMPLAILEAMASGLPIVGADVPGIKELVSDVGVLVHNPSAKTFAVCLDKVLSNPTNLRELSRKSSATANQYSWSVLTDHFEHVYKGLDQ